MVKQSEAFQPKLSDEWKNNSNLNKQGSKVISLGEFIKTAVSFYHAKNNQY